MSLAPHNDQQTSEAYIETIQSFSGRSQDEYLHCGAHYSSLNRLLAPTAASSRKSLSRSSPLSSRSNLAANQDAPFPFVTVIDILKDSEHASRRRVRQLCTPQEYVDGDQVSPDCAQILFLQGYPSAEWISTLGACFRVDPEFWRRHLDFLPSRELYDLPPLPSFAARACHLRLDTILKPASAITREEVNQWRVEGGDILSRSHYLELDRTKATGESIVRRLHFHSESIFTVEQRISCTLVTKNNSWAALVWLDIGKPLPPALASWLSNKSFLGAARDSYIPIIQPTEKAALKQPTTTRLGAAHHLEPSSTVQSSTLLPTQYGPSLKDISMGTSPLYALSDVFRHAACSSNQFVNLVKTRMDDAMKTATNDRHEEIALADLRYSKETLDDHAAYLLEVVSFLERGHLAWAFRPAPLSTNNSGQSTARRSSSAIGANDGGGATQTSQQDLLRDFQCLMRRVDVLRQRCMDSISIILNSTMLRESQKGIEQAEEVKKLTNLVLIFAPLSFFSSIFGMNFVDIPWKTGTPIFLVIVVLVISWLFKYRLKMKDRMGKATMSRS